MNLVSDNDALSDAFPGGNERTGSEKGHARGRYYPHIDGLRCLAVLPVIAYHFAMTACPAGFMGVDIFFVISGFLICGSILRDLEAKTFSITHFYHRRIRRIFPAYFVLVAGVLAVGAELYHWARLVPFSQTALFSALFSTNIYFWLDMGYFQPNAHENPLLNLWSLGIEEQFYLVIPLCSVVLWKIHRRAPLFAYVTGLMVSLALCVHLGHRGDSTTAFYLFPTRAWELLAGGVLAAAPPSKESSRGRWLALAGVVLVVASFWCFSTRKTFNQAHTNVEFLLPWMGSLGMFPFPGWVNVPVIAGSILLIRYGYLEPVARVLCNRPMVDIGRVSYSLYLWHWPVVVFLRYLTYDRPSSAALWSAAILAFILAYLSWRYVELPVRLARGFTAKRAFSSLAAGTALLVSICGLFIQTDGLRTVFPRRGNSFASPPQPFSDDIKKHLPLPPYRALHYPEMDANYFGRLGVPGRRPSFCLVGDSHSQALAPGLDVAAAEFQFAGLQVKVRIHPYIDEEGAYLLNWIAENPDVSDVYLVGRWLTRYSVEDGIPTLEKKGLQVPLELEPATSRTVEKNFRRTAVFFRNHGKSVYVFTCVPEYGYRPADMMARGQLIPWNRQITMTAQEYFNRQRPVSDILKRLQDEGLLKVIPLGETLLREGRTVIMSAAGEPYYKDGDHLTLAGATYAAKSIAPLLWSKP